METRHYLSASIFALFFLLEIVFGLHETLAQSPGLFNQLVEASKAEMAKKEGKLHMATSWRKKEGLAILKAFQKDFPFVKKFDFTRARGVPYMQRIFLEVQQGRIPEFDILAVSSEVWPDYRRAGLLVKPPFDTHKLAKSLPAEWGKVDPRAIDAEGMFIATGARGHGNAWNPELVPKGKEPTTWEACVDPMWKGKFLYDPRPKLMGLWYDPKTREAHIQWLKGIMRNGAVLNRGQTENLQKVVGGEYPILCGVAFRSTIRMIDRGAPLKFALPDPFPMNFSTEIHVVKWSKIPATTQLVALWLASTGQDVQDKVGYLGFPWNPKTRVYPFAKGKSVAICSADCRRGAGKYHNLHADILKLPGVR